MCDDEAQYEQEIERGGREIIYVKYMVEGVSDLGTVADYVEAFARDLRAKEADGFVLESPVDTGYLHLVKKHLVA